ncbi:hypothetical protein FOZ60_005756 [Perkinsus olseni]|uniref:Uncharacterized protein n=1 Tax=Perkinsus olseni TaxID=32597 RepID=A0A7J6NQ98_PEROL|nr:hypothetical protein FOZ60_005756 [Perkinsus olseni]
MNDSDSPTDTELSLGRTVLEPQDATEIRKWRTSTSLGPGLQSFPLDFDPSLISPDQTDYLLARLLEFETVPLSGVKVFVSNLASAMASSAAGAESSTSPTVARPPLEFARAILAMVLHAGLVHGMPMRPLLWLGSALAVASTKRKYRIARSVELGNERHYVDALLEALRDQASQAGTISATSQSSSGNPGVASRASRQGITTTSLSRERAPLNVFKLPLEYTEFEGPTSATYALATYAAFKGGVQTSINFYGIDNDRDCMLFLFRHIGKGLKSEIITHLGTAQPAPSAIWEALKQHTGEKVDEFYARVKSEWLLFSRVSGVTLPLPFVSAKFVGGLLPDIKAPLEASCGHQLPKLPLEEARDAALYHESRVSSSRSEGSSRKVNSNKRQSLPVGQAPQSNQSGSKEVKEPPVGKDDATGGSDTKGNKPRCSFCATRRYRGSNKHDDAHCWKNPANAHLVPDWYRQRQAEAAAAKAPKGSGDG